MKGAADLGRTLFYGFGRDYGVSWHRRLTALFQPLTVLATVGVMATIVAVCLDERGWPPAVVCGAAILVGVLWPRISLRPLSGEWSFAAPRAVEGEPTIVRLQLRNRAPWRAWGLCFEAEGPGFSELTALAPLGSFADETFVWDLTPPRRGCFPRRAACLSTGFPFGLEQQRKTIVAAVPLLVLPHTWPIVGLPSPRRLPTFDGAAALQRTGDSGTTLGVRPFRRGDARRDVHWRQTARRGDLIVREREAIETARLRLVVDASRTSCGFDEPEAVLDWLARFAASVTEQLDGVAATELAVLPAGRGPAVVRGETQIGDALGRLVLDEGSSSRTFREAAKRLARGVQAWFITTPEGYSHLSAEDRTAKSWAFFLVDTMSEHSWPSHEPVGEVGGRSVYRVALPAGSKRNRFVEAGEFYVR